MEMQQSVPHRAKEAMIPNRYLHLTPSLFLTGTLLVAFQSFAAIHPTLAPDHPRIDMLDHPIGLSDSDPQFSWTLKAGNPQAHNLSQSAYRIAVASSSELLLADKPDLWDSGQVASPNFREIPYAGRALAPQTTYFWRIRVWDQAGIASKWTSPQTWTTGLLSASDWSALDAHWIAAKPDGAPPPPSTDDTSSLTGIAVPLPIFRREFSIAKPVRQALVFVTGLGQYELTVNARDVTKTVLNPGWTDFRKTVLYQGYDVTQLLHSGGNCLGVLLGNGMYSVPGVHGRYTKFVGSFGQPKLILQMKLKFADGASQTIVSDRSWKTIPGPIRFSSTYGGEDYDARKNPLGWQRRGFDDSAWSSAEEVAAPADPVTHAAVALSGAIIPSIRPVETLAPIRITHPSPGVVVYDFGRNFSGWPQIAVRGHAGASIKLTPGELLDVHGIVSQRSANAGPDDPVLFQYTLRGSPQPETWHPRFTYYGFRYLQVDLSPSDHGLDDRPRIVSASAQVVHDDVPATGSFVSQLPLFNRIHKLIDAAIGSNLVSVLTDCPTREKLGWLEQTHLMGPSIMDDYDVSGLYRKLSNDMADAQLANGLVPSIAPEYVAFVNKDGSSTDFRDSPEWGSAVILSPWAAYQFYGDAAQLASHYDSMTHYAAYLRGKAKDGILDYGLGDWYDIGPDAPGYSQLTGKGLTATATYYQDLTALAQIAAILGKSDDAQNFATQAEAVKEAFNRQFFHPEINQYDRGSQTAYAMPLALGLVPEDRRSAVVANLVADIRQHGNHVTAGDIGFHYVVRALTDAGRSDVLFDMLTRTDSPSYGYQLAKGATTLTEAWDANPGSSQDHFMLGHAEEWFYRGLAGIRLDLSRPASEQIVIRPALLKQAKGARASIDSVLGPILATWTYTDSWTVDVEIPPGSTAQVLLPGPASKIAGTSSDSNNALLQSKFVEGFTMVSIGSGNYRFRQR